MSGNSGTVDIKSPYGYTPSRGVAVVFIILFLASTVVHGYQAARSRMWWLFPTVGLCGCIELLGWSGRLWSSYSPLASLPFEIQITAIIVAPTPLLAASFVILGDIIKRLGPSYSRLTPKWYTIVFCTCDFFALLVQGAGGGMAASASDLQGANKASGAHVMLFGIVFQLIVIVGYSCCAAEFFVRYHKYAPFSRSSGVGSRGMFTPNIKSMSWALVFSTTCLFIRSIYRIIELAGGWNGKILHTEIYFNILDGVMIILAIYTLNFFHPGRLLAREDGNEEKELDYVSV